MLVLDPGHGGENIGANDGYENYLNLIVGSIANEIIESVFELDILMTRVGEYDVSWDERREIAEGADCVISIHHNAIVDPERLGLELYHWPGNMISKGVCREAIMTAPTETRRIIEPSKADYPGANFICGTYAAPTILVECCYLSNAQDLEFTRYKYYAERMGLFIANLALSCNEVFSGRQVEV